MDIKNTTKRITVVDTSDPDLSAYSREIGAEAENVEVSRNQSGQIVQNGEDVIKEELNVTLNNIENKTYNINDASSVDINDTDYIPMSNSEGTEKKKSTWAVLISKIKQVFGIQSETGDETKFLNKKGEWTEPANTWEANSVSKDGYVTKGNGQNNKIWKTDANGNPSWREYDNLSFHIVDTLDANVVLEDGIWQVRGSITNVPILNPPATGGVFWNIKSVGTPYQMYFPDNTIKIYKRWYINNTWQPWREIDTNTWRGIQNNLTSDSTTDSLAAAQGKTLKTLIDGKAATNHTHLYAGSSSAGGAANNALKLGGYSASTSATANSIAMRQGNGYLYATYFNQSSGDESMNTSSKFMFTNSDGFLRKGTIASAKTALGLGSAAYSNTSAFAAAGHTHLYAGSASVGGDASRAIALKDKSNNNSTYLNYGATALTTASYIGAWDGYTLKAMTPQNLRNTMGLGNTTGALPIANGGTGAISVSAARTNLGVPPTNHASSATTYGVGTSSNFGHLKITDSPSSSHNAASGVAAAAATLVTLENYVKSGFTNVTTTFETLTKTVMMKSGGTFTGNVAIQGGNYRLTLGKSSNKGTIRLYSNTAHYISLVAGNSATESVTCTLPIQGGTIQTNKTSSKRIKKNISNMTYEEAKKILDINVIKFDYIKGFGNGEKNQYGMIAEDVINIIPNAVNIPDEYDETKPVNNENNPSPSIDYREFVPYLIKMVQIQQKEIDELKTKIRGD